MASRVPDIAFIGFGEAAMAFAEGLGRRASGYDVREDAGKRADFARLAVGQADGNAAAIKGVGTILSLVTADQAASAGRETARGIAPGALFCDMNSVAPDTKRATAVAIEAAGGRYVDVAVMAPVHPARRHVPLLVSGSHAVAGAAALRDLGFANVRVVDGGIGAASAIKMIRSVMVKGLEALTTECVLAADRAGVLDEVIASLDASWPGAEWARRADYNLDRMMIHGERRAAEMEEVAKTLDALGTGAAMTRGAVVRQRAIGRLNLSPPQGLAAKLAALSVAPRQPSLE